MNDAELDLLLRDAAAPAPQAGLACIDTPEFDLGRVLAVGAGGEDDPAALDALDHIARCGFCRALLRDVVAEPANDFLVARLNREWPPVATDAPPKRRVAFAAVASLVAMAAALAIVLLRPQPVAPVSEYDLTGPFGGLTGVRADVPESNVFVPDSQVRIVLHPKGAGQAGGGSLAVFRLEADQRLLRLPAGLAKVQGNGAWLIEGEGRALFGETAGEKRLLLIVAGGADALNALEGKPRAALSGREDLRSYEVKVEYRLVP